MYHDMTDFYTLLARLEREAFEYQQEIDALEQLLAAWQEPDEPEWGPDDDIVFDDEDLLEDAA